MARYIDADKLCEALKSMASVQYPDKQSTILGVVSSIEIFPTADVVPKSEAEKLEVYIDDLNDSKEHLAVMLSEAENQVEILQAEINAYSLAKKYDAQHFMADIKKLQLENNILIKNRDMLLQSYVKKIFEEIEMLLKVGYIPCTAPDGNISVIKSKLWSIDPNDFAKLKKKYTERVCTDCIHFVGCECFSGMTCDQYETEVKNND